MRAPQRSIREMAHRLTSRPLPTDDVVGMGFEPSVVESIAKRFRRAQKTKKDVLTTAILTELVLSAT